MSVLAESTGAALRVSGATFAAESAVLVGDPEASEPALLQDVEIAAVKTRTIINFFIRVDLILVAKLLTFF